MIQTQQKCTMLSSISFHPVLCYARTTTCGGFTLEDIDVVSSPAECCNRGGARSHRIIGGDCISW